MELAKRIAGDYDVDGFIVKRGGKAASHFYFGAEDAEGRRDLWRIRPTEP